MYTLPSWEGFMKSQKEYILNHFIVINSYYESYQFMLVYCLGVFNIVYDVYVNPSFSMLSS